MKINKNNKDLRKIAFLSLVIIVLTSIFLLSLTSDKISAGVNEISVTSVEIGRSPPILNTTINGDADSVDLIAEYNTSINCTVVVTDNNGENDVILVNATFYEINGTTGSNGYSEGSPNDNNYHYYIDNCTLDTSYGNEYEVEALCQFNITYYANNATWICEASAEDSGQFTGKANDSIVVNELVALHVPTSINYGQVDALAVSWENATNVTNMGNVDIDLNLDGYADYDGDGRAMTCTSGSIGNISIEHEKYNITNSTVGLTLSLAEVDITYTNLSDTAVFNDINISQRQEDSMNGTDDYQTTYWRIYVPDGVAGTCQGNITFAAIAG